ncbi:MAG TPA: DUF4255 domain-containing protein [Anaerolineae bacterium]|nr:DUF4255 domain-containing protein [Anaerolineae bacterium]
MSNFCAIATVTATLDLEVLQPAAGAAVPGATVTLIRPDAPGGGPAAARVNAYLYQVTPNASYRNTDLPTRNSDGQLVQRPRAALDLHYLLTFYGDEAQLEPQRLLGNIALAMHTKSTLTRAMIRNTITNVAFAFLAQADLADEIELVKFTPTAFSLEEMAKLWSVFFQTQYTLSMAYQATVVLLEGEDTPRRALPVIKQAIYALPFRQPSIDRIRVESDPEAPILPDSVLLIEGRQLRSSNTQLRFGDNSPFAVQPESQTRLRLDLTQAPANQIRAGVQPVQIVQPLQMGQPPVDHPGFESNVAAMIVHPKITVTNATAAIVSLTVEPTVGKQQRVSLLLDEATNQKPESYVFKIPSRNADQNTLDIAISGVKPADYFIRLQIDGAESILDLDPASPTFGPKVTIS